MQGLGRRVRRPSVDLRNYPYRFLQSGDGSGLEIPFYCRQVYESASFRLMHRRWNAEQRM